MNKQQNKSNQVNNSNLGHSKNNELFAISVDTTLLEPASNLSLEEMCESFYAPDKIADAIIERLEYGLLNGVVEFDNDIENFFYDAVYETAYGFLELDLDDERREYGFAYGFESDLFNINISLLYSELCIAFLF